MKTICDLCEKETKATKQDGIWVCDKCDKKYPKEKYYEKIN